MLCKVVPSSISYIIYRGNQSSTRLYNSVARSQSVLGNPSTKNIRFTHRSGALYQPLSQLTPRALRSPFCRRLYSHSVRAMSTAYDFPSPIVTPDWLQENLHSVKVVDASWYMPNVPRNAKEEYETERIPGAAFFDLDGICDKSVDLPHMLPSCEQFAAAADAIGLSSGTPVVVYDASGLFSAARAWWTLKVPAPRLQPLIPAQGRRRSAHSSRMATGEARTHTGEPRTHTGCGSGTLLRVPVARKSVLLHWANSRQEACAASAGRTSEYPAALNTKAVRSIDQVLSNINSKEEQVVDARSAGRFAGTAPEPRSGVRGGHMPGSINVPFNEVLTEDGNLKNPTDLREIFQTAGVDLGRPIIASCGTGVTACVLALALDSIGKEVSLYDGSWTEWGLREDTPVISDE
ncbi:hypothetical protein CYMTET_6906 [Cymbomonas tetramitiformis]|uniref:Sulfurtransferase n=1 Tax=Cymbomonas tetramitiformis TaxID=36881 RepID=A0AAE0GW89_9CHLO|nr:hypothetical protein CYMTET_6906 [Cymbomonas tetramitiformis]